MHLGGHIFLAWPLPLASHGCCLPPAEVPVPANLQEEMEKRRQELVEHVAEVGGGEMHCSFLLRSRKSIAALMWRCTGTFGSWRLV